MRRRRSRSLVRFGVLAGMVLAVLLAPHAASAQISLSPDATSVKDTGGWVYWMAEGAIILGGVILIFFGAMYLRYAPRFQREEEEAPSGRARASEPSVPLQTSWQQSSPPVAVQAVPAPQPVAVAAVAAPVPAAAAAPAPGAAAAPTATATAPADAPPPPAPGPAAAPRHREPAEIDQETFDGVLAEETAKGTSARVAEGRAKSAAVKAWRAKNA